MLGIELTNRIKQLNPWIINPEKTEMYIHRFLPDNYIHRQIEETPAKKDRAVLIVGPRQAGKTTMIWHLLRQVMPDILYLNMEDPLLRTGPIDPVDVVELIQKDYAFVKAIFIDEIQHLVEAGLFVKGLVDARLDRQIWVTGSSSYDLRSKTRESLAGRVIRRRIMPFSVGELLRHTPQPNLPAEKQLCEQILLHQLVFGSYPSIYQSEPNDEKIMLLNDLVEALILRDASDLFKIKRVDAFRKLLTLLAGQTGSLLNMSELASICNIDVGTITSYIQLLEESHIVKKLLPFAGGKRREITGAPKVYFIDNGIRNHLLNNFSTELDLRIDKGQLLENWAFSEIHKTLPFQASLKFWRSKAKAEVDFIIEYAGKVYALEVKFASLKSQKVSKSVWSFIEAYQPEEFIIVNMSLDSSIALKKTKINFITPYELIKWLNTIFQVIKFSS